MRWQREAVAAFLKNNMLWLCMIVAVYTAIVPFARTFFHLQVTYNEGWNVYTAERLVHHELLYPVKYGWTTVNYPMVSFYMMAHLHSLTHDYLFTARIISLLSLFACSLLVAAIVAALGASRRFAVLAGFFCFGVFCADADFYVGVDDPQLLAQAFFLLGLYVYIRSRRSVPSLAVSALIFVFALFIKQNPIDVPIAVLIDLSLISIPLALWFSACGVAFTVCFVLVNIKLGGPFFISELFMPRSYSVLQVLEHFRNVFGPLLLPFCLGVIGAWKLRKNSQRRIAAIFFATSLSIGGYFCGGSGVSINALFSAMAAMCIVLGLCGDDFKGFRRIAPNLAVYAPLVLFSWLAIPLMITGNIDVMGSLRELSRSQDRFCQDVAALRSRPGPALCESLLECYAAGKPYVYDPFNATRLIRLGKLDSSVVVGQLQRRQFSAIQLDSSLEQRVDPNRFQPEILAAIGQNYVPILDHLGAVIYVPR